MGLSTIQSVYLLDQSAVAIPNTGSTTLNTLKTIVLPANLLGRNGSLSIETMWSNNNNANNKNAVVNFGGTQVQLISQSTNLSLRATSLVMNRNATNSQITRTFNTGVIYGAMTAAPTTLAIDTAGAVNILLQSQLVNAGDTQTLEYYQILYYPKFT